MAHPIMTKARGASKKGPREPTPGKRKKRTASNENSVGDPEPTNMAAKGMGKE